MTDKSVPALLSQMEPEFKKALGNTVPSERFTRIAITAVKSNPDLATLDRASLFKSIMQAAQDGLVIDGREAAIIPFKGKAQYLPMVAGLIKKLRQHSNFASISTGIIYQREVETGAFEYVKGDDEFLTHKPIVFGEKGEAIGAYAVVTTKDGEKFRAVLDKAQIEKRRNAGRAGGNGPWQSWWEEMWQKTAIKAVYKIAPNSGDEAGVLSDVLEREDDEPDAPVVEHVEEAAPEAPKQSRAAAAVKASVKQSEVNPPPVEDIEDADYVTVDEDGVIQEELEPPM